MALVSSQLYREVLDIISRGERPVHFLFEAEIVANGKVIKAQAGAGYTRLRDYLKDFAEDATIELMIPAGTYMYQIYPYRRDLKIRVYAYPQMEALDMTDKRRPPTVKEYKAVIFDTDDPSIDQEFSSAQTEQGANISTMNKYTFQLIDPVVEQLRLQLVGGVFRGDTPGGLLRTLLTHYSLSLDFPADKKPLGVGMVEPNNQEVRQSFLLRHGAPLVDQEDGTFGLARYLQFKGGGIYNGGIASFYQDRFWYVFPPFDVTRYDTAKRKLTVANIPEKDMRQPERSYKVEGNNVYIVATGKTIYKDPSEHEQLNGGNGVRFSNPSKVFDGLLSGPGNRATANRSTSMTELVGDENPQKLTHAPLSKDAITSNSCAQMTPIAFKRGSLMQLAWEHSNENIVFPGMPSRILFERNGNIEMLDGVLVGIETHSAPTGNMSAREGWLTTSALTFFVTRSTIDKPKNKA